MLTENAGSTVAMSRQALVGTSLSVARRFEPDIMLPRRSRHPSASSNGANADYASGGGKNRHTVRPCYRRRSVFPGRLPLGRLHDFGLKDALAERHVSFFPAADMLCHVPLTATGQLRPRAMHLGLAHEVGAKQHL